ncbi:ACS8 [Scenedesmus sp. PABB004]|nr:ACS8 [Scenedesmus sp. PABB004]
MQLLRAPAPFGTRPPAPCSRRAAPGAPALRQRGGPARSSSAATADRAVLFGELQASCAAFKKAPPSMKFEYSADVLRAMNTLKAAGLVPKWGAEAPDEAGGDAGGPAARRNVFMGELKQMGIKSPDTIATPSVRNDAAFLYTTVGVVSVLAVAAGQLPGDWGFFSSYLIGSTVLVVLAIGSTAPGLLQVFIDKFSQVFPDYRDRVVAHEAAHLLLGYLMGVPVTNYGLGIGKEHVEFAEAKLQARIITRDLSDAEIDALSVVAVAGIAAEGLRYDEVMGQTADLSDLQRILLRSRTKLSAAQQQNITRWAVWRAAALLKQYSAEHQAVQEAIARGDPVDAVVQIIEGVKPQSQLASMASDGFLAPRAARALQPALPYWSAFAAALNDQWSADNPGGTIACVVAENRLSCDLVAAGLAKHGGAFPEHLLHYQDMRGIPELRAALVGLLRDTFMAGVPVQPQELSVLSGAGSVLDVLFHCLAPPGAGVLIPAPWYAAFPNDLEIRNAVTARPVQLDACDQDYGAALDAAAAAAAAAGQPVAALLFTHPSNPQGTLLSRAQLRSMVRWCLANRVHCISDEIYANSVFDERAEFISAAQLVTQEAAGWPDGGLADSLVHVVFGMSKDFCASGLRVGCLWSRNEALNRAIDNASYFCSTPAPLQWALASLLGDKDWLAGFFQTNRARLRAAYESLTGALDAAGIPHVPAVAAMFCWVDLRAAFDGGAGSWADEDALWRCMVEQHKVLLTPGSCCAAAEPGFFRICFAWPPTESLPEALCSAMRCRAPPPATRAGAAGGSSGCRRRRCAPWRLLAAAAPPSNRWMRVVQPAEHDWYWGSHEGERGGAGAAAGGGASAPAAAGPSAEALMSELAAADGPEALLELAETSGDLPWRAAHWVRLLFRLLVQLHERAEWPGGAAEAHAALPGIAAAAAAALTAQLQEAAQRGPQQQGPPQQAQRAASASVSAVADMAFALAVHALDCSRAPGEQQQPCWYLSPGCVTLVDAVAAVGGSCDLATLSRGDAVSLLWACGQLERLQRGAGAAPAARGACVGRLAGHVAALVRYSNNTEEPPPGLVRAGGASGSALLDPFHADDLADALAGLAAAGHRGAGTAPLLDAVAHEAYRQLSNRHSAGGGSCFSVEGVVSLVTSYAQLDYADGPAPRLFDAVAGWLAKRVRARHVQAPSSPAQLAAVAGAFAALPRRHRSVAVPELLSALDLQAARAAAAAVELRHAPGGGYGGPGSAYCHWSLGHAAALLRAHVELGFAPPQATLSALGPALLLALGEEAEQPPAERARDATAVLGALAVLAHHPGPQVLPALAAAAWADDPAARLPPSELVALLFASAQLGAAPPPGALAPVAEALLLATAGGGDGGGDGDGDGSGTAADAAGDAAERRRRRRAARRPLSAAEAVRALWGLAVLGALDVAALGWLLVGLAGGAWQRLEGDQLLAVAAAQRLLGQDGTDMAREVLPPLLLARTDAAWQRWLATHTVEQAPGGGDGGGGGSGGGGKPAGVSGELWAAHVALDGWLRGATAAGGSCSGVVVPPDPPAHGEDGGEQSPAAQPARLLLGAWLVQPPPGGARWPGALQRPLALTPCVQPRGECPDGGTAAREQQLLLACPAAMHSSGEPPRPLGAALLHARLARAWAAAQTGGGGDGRGGALGAVHVPLDWRPPQDG